MYLLGYDAGTSSIKASLLEAETGTVTAAATYPPKEMSIISNNPGWAEQDPETWWDALRQATQMLLDVSHVNAPILKVSASATRCTGWSVSMQTGRSCVRRSSGATAGRFPMAKKRPPRSAPKKCLETMLNHVGNFTAGKLAWVKENEPDIYAKIGKIMLPAIFWQ